MSAPGDGSQYFADRYFAAKYWSIHYWYAAAVSSLTQAVQRLYIGLGIRI
jgi:hypothetical protein